MHRSPKPALQLCSAAAPASAAPSVLLAASAARSSKEAGGVASEAWLSSVLLSLLQAPSLGLRALKTLRRNLGQRT